MSVGLSRIWMLEWNGRFRSQSSSRKYDNGSWWQFSFFISVGDGEKQEITQSRVLIFDVPMSSLVTEVVTAAPAVGQTVPGIVTNIWSGYKETAPATITNIQISVLDRNLEISKDIKKHFPTETITEYADFVRYFLFPFRWQEIDDLKFITRKSFSHEIGEGGENDIDLFEDALTSNRENKSPTCIFPRKLVNAERN